jgi:hypothetical protein
METNAEIGQSSQIEACRREKMSNNLEEAIRSLIEVHTFTAPDGSTAILWGAMPADDPISYIRYREAWALLADALQRGAFRDAGRARSARKTRSGARQVR